jgi:hypothetical protein
MRVCRGVVAGAIESDVLAERELNGNPDYAAPPTTSGKVVGSAHRKTTQNKTTAARGD